MRQVWAVLLPLLLLLAGCGRPAAGGAAPLRLATTTSTEDSGLLAAILPAFEQESGLRVEVVAVGTGQALALAARGDADVVLVHARAQEEAFLAAGHGVRRQTVMYNDFVIVGPENDPAGVRGMRDGAAALARVAAAGAPFLSRGDESGTHSRELALWEAAGIVPSGDWYRAVGQGMGETLVTAAEIRGYTLTDRGTYLSMQARLPGLIPLVGGGSIGENPDERLLNPYGVIPVSAATHPGVNQPQAEAFVTWLLSPATQSAIGAFGRERFGQPLFYPGAPPGDE